MYNLFRLDLSQTQQLTTRPTVRSQMFDYLKRIILPNKLPIALHMSKAKIILIYSKNHPPRQSIPTRHVQRVVFKSSKNWTHSHSSNCYEVAIAQGTLINYDWMQVSIIQSGWKQGLIPQFFSHNYGNLAVIWEFPQFMWQFTVKIWLNYKSVIYRNRPLVQRNTDIFVNAKKR